MVKTSSSDLPEENGNRGIDHTRTDGSEKAPEVVEFILSVDLVASLAEVEERVQLFLLVLLSLFCRTSGENLTGDTLLSVLSFQSSWEFAVFSRQPGVFTLEVLGATG